MSLPAELAALRDEALQFTCESYAIRKRWPLSKGIDRAGACPICGGTDRFVVRTMKNSWLCRRCDKSGAGVISLVMFCETVEFVEACEIITGRKASAPIDEKRAAELAERNASDERRRQSEAERYREEARKQGYETYTASSLDWSGAVFEYLLVRGIDLTKIDSQVPLSALKIRQHPNLQYIDKVQGQWTTLHIGPALIAAVQRPDERFGAVHQTWIDLAQEKGKYVPPLNDEGKARPSKKVRGVMKGGAIRLYTPANPTRLVMGEGIETTLTALAYNIEPDTAYWTGVALGNMAGRAKRDGAGKPLHAEPDLDDIECFIPPEWVRELVFLCDSDEAENRTVDKITRGLLRAEAHRPGIQCSYVPPIGDGKDLNDLVMVKR